MGKKSLEINSKLIDKLDKMSDKQLLKYAGIHKAHYKIRPLKNESLSTQLETDDIFAINFNKNITIPFLRELIHLAKHYINLELAIFAHHQRSAKSSLGISVMLFFSKLINYKPTVKNDIFSNQHAWLSAVPNRKFNSIGCIDETKRLQAQIGAVVAEEELKDIQKIIAKELLHSIKISRNVDLDSNAHYALMPFGLDYKTGLIKALVYDLEKSDMGYKQLLGYITFPHYDKSVVKYNHFELQKLPRKKLTPMQRFRVDYENKKDKWNADIKYRKVGERAKERLKTARELSKNDLFIKCKNNSERRSIARFFVPQGYSEDEISEVVRFARDIDILTDLENRLGVKAKTRQAKLGESL